MSALPLSPEARAPVGRVRAETTGVGGDGTGSKYVAADLCCVAQEPTVGDGLDVWFYRIFDLTAIPFIVRCKAGNAQVATADEGLARDGKPFATPSTPWGSRPPSSVSSDPKSRPVTRKKVASLPVDGSNAMKRANKIGMAIPALEPDIAGKNITAAALLTQRKLARSVRRVCGYLGMTRIRCRALPELQACLRGNGFAGGL